MKKRLEQWWECPNQGCGAEILFLMLGPGAVQVEPTCFCGSPMRRADKSRARRHSVPGRRAVNVRRVALHAPATKRVDVPASSATLVASGTRRE